MCLGIIGGSGLSNLDELETFELRKVKTPYGAPSSELTFGKLHGAEVIFLARHGNRHIIPPHKINYRANISALRDCGVKNIVAIATVGGIQHGMAPGRLVVPDQLIDYTYDRQHTFFEDDLDHVTHIDFTQPYSETIRQQLLLGAKNAGISIQAKGTYGCTQGPRLETAAEIVRMQNDGCDLVGMTGMPETSLARELNIHYACCAIVANRAAGKLDGKITMSEIGQNIEIGMKDLRKLLRHFVAGFNASC